MLRIKKISIAIIPMIIGLIISCYATAQTKYPQIGKPCPDFKLDDIEYYAKKTAQLKDFKGKWLILDFWTETCTACIASFPHTSNLQKEFGDKVQIMMVGWPNIHSANIKAMYRKYHQSENLAMPCAFDSLLVNRFQPAGFPYVIVIDDKGIVQAITNGVTESDLKQFLAGQHPLLRRAQDGGWQRIEINSAKPILVNGNGGNDSDFFYRSLLSHWRPNMTYSSASTKAVENGQLEVMGRDLYTLYRLAYFGHEHFSIDDTAAYGRYYNQPVLNVKDSSVFRSNDITGQGMYCYSLVLPQKASSKEKFEKIMQMDLTACFGYDVRIITKPCPCYKLVTTQSNSISKLKANSDSTYLRLGRDCEYLVAKNQPAGALVLMMSRCLGGGSDQKPFILVNGIESNENLDLDLSDCVISNLQSLRSALQKHGLDIVPGEKEMKVLEISDPQ